MFNNSGNRETPPDPFQTEDPFKSNLLDGTVFFICRFFVFVALSPAAD